LRARSGGSEPERVGRDGHLSAATREARDPFAPC
jgi:hypothetical protein